MKLSIIIPVYNVEKYNLYGIYCDLSPKERHASETKATMALHCRELKELFKRGRLSFKSRAEQVCFVLLQGYIRGYVMREQM